VPNNNTYFKYVFVVITLIFLVLRFSSFTRTDIGFDPYDSPSYFNPTWDSPVRMPVISYLFSSLKYFGAIVVVQTMIGIIAWIFLSYSISLLISSFSIKTISSLLVYSLALSSPIVAFDSIILSESLTISFYNYIIAFLILFFHNLRTISLFGIVLATIIYAGLKQSNAHFSLVILTFLFIYLILNYKLINYKSIKFLTISTAVIINIFFIIIARQNDEINSNVEVTNIIERSFDTYALQNYWIELGFPGIAYQAYSSPPLQPPIGKTRSLPQVKAWEQFEKRSPIEIYAIKNLDFLILAPLKPNLFIPHFTDFESILSPIVKGYRLDQNRLLPNLVSGSSEPFYLEELNLPRTLWWQEKSNESKLLFLILIAPILLFLLLSAKISSKLPQVGRHLVILVLPVTVVSIWATWHISVNYEMSRYLMPWAISIRILFIVTLVVLFERLREGWLSNT
jgi:hypothetical protein